MQQKSDVTLFRDAGCVDKAVLWLADPVVRFGRKRQFVDNTFSMNPSRQQLSKKKKT